MVSATLAAGAALTLGAAWLYAVVGLRFARRARDARSTTLGLFALFWWALAFYGVADALWSLAVPLFSPPVAVGITILYTKTIVGCAGFLGLVNHLLVLYTGREDLLPRLAALYALIGVLVLYSYAVSDPVGQEAQTWRSGLVYANDGGLVGTLSVVALFLPPLLASLAYAALLARVREPELRRRIGTVSAALLAFFGGLLVGWTLAPAWWPPVEKLLAIGAAVSVLWAEER